MGISHVQQVRHARVEEQSWSLPRIQRVKGRDVNIMFAVGCGYGGLDCKNPSGTLLQGKVEAGFR